MKHLQGQSHYKRHILGKAIAALMLTSLHSIGHAADTATDVEALRQEVAELKKVVQTLMTQQQAATPLSPAPATVAQTASSRTASTAQVAKPIPSVAKTAGGWATLPEGKTSAKIYGLIRADMFHDFKGQPTGKFSNLHTQPLNSTDPVDNKTTFTAAATRVGVDFKTPTAMGDVGAKIEADFWGNGGTGSATFRIRHAYLTSGNWLFGQTWSPFAGQDYRAETVDTLGVAGSSNRRAPQIRYTYPLSNAIALMLAAEEDTSGDARFPALSTRLEYKLTEKKGAFSLRSMLHEKRGIVSTVVGKQTQNSVDEKVGYGAALGAWYQLNSDNKLTGQFFHVKGDGSFNQGTGRGFSVNKKTADVYFDEYDSAQLGITHQFNPKVRSTLALSWVDFKDSSDYAMANPDSNKTLKQATVNVFYTPVQNLALASEYTYGQREVFGGDKAKQSHLNLSAQYSF